MNIKKKRINKKVGKMKNSKMKTKGIMGIGTLIIFIGIILVAAVAAMVLISTSGSLQQRALATGGQTEEGISTGIDIFSVVGRNASDGKFDTLELLARLNPGSSSVKLNNSVMTLNTKNTFQRLIYAGTNTAATSSTFNVTYLQNGSNNQVDYITEGDIIKMEFITARNISESERLRIKFIPRIGTTTEVEFTTPDTMTTARVNLYP